MPKYIFALLILLHGLIHLMGFAKAFGYGNITLLTKEISKASGLLWLLTACMFITVAIFFLLNKESWPAIAIVTVIISEILIAAVWKDAKFGTIANFIILLVTIPAFFENSFNRMVNNEATALLEHVEPGRTQITQEMLAKLPPICRKWLINSGVVGKERIDFVRLKQQGEMRTKPGGKWMPFTATEYFTVNKPQFIWQTKVQMMPLITLDGRDKFEGGNGRMLIKLLSLINVVNKGGDDKMNHSTMLRYLAETCWFPTAALSDYITWQPTDSLSAKATLNYKSQRVSGIFQFNSDGEITSFTSDRWYSSDGNTDETLEKWLVEMKAYKKFQGIRIPYKTDVTWKLKTGNFHWLKLELVDLEFNKPELYK